MVRLVAATKVVARSDPFQRTEKPDSAAYNVCASTGSNTTFTTARPGRPSERSTQELNPPGPALSFTQSLPSKVPTAAASGALGEKDMAEMVAKALPVRSGES